MENDRITQREVTDFAIEQQEADQEIWEYRELIAEGPDGDCDLDYLI